MKLACFTLFSRVFYFFSEISNELWGMFKKRFKREDKTYVVMKYQNKNSAVVLLYFPYEEKKRNFFFLHQNYSFWL